MSTSAQTPAVEPEPRGRRPASGTAFPIAPRWLALAVLVAVGGVSAFAASRVRIVEEISALLPERDDREGDLRLARQAGLMQRVAIAIGPDEPGSERLYRGADAVAAAVASLPGVSGVVARVDPEGARRAAELLMRRAMRLHRPRGGALGPQQIRQRLAGLKERLASPEALVMQQYLLADPLGFSREALRGLEAAAHGIGATVDRGHLFAADRRYALVFVEVAFDPLDAERSAAFVGQLEGSLRSSLTGAGLDDLGAVALGGPHFVAASAGTMIRDVRIALAITAALVLLIFALFLGRVRLLPAALLPGAVGIGVALGAMGLAGVELHALTVGFAAAITGISVDYAIHLLHRALHREGHGTRERIEGALGAVWRPVVLGCATTALAFVIVSFTGFPGVRQLAIFSAISVPVALVATLFVLPPFHRFLLGGRSGSARLAGRLSTGVSGLLADRPSRARRLAVAACFGAVAAVAIWLAHGARLSGDPRDMGFRDPEISRREGLLARLFPGLTGQSVVVARASSPEEALEINDELYGALADGGFAADRVFSVSQFLPAPRTQERSLRAVRELLEDGATREAFLAQGFTPEYFDGLSAGLEATPLVPGDFAGTGLEELVAESLREREGRHYVTTRVLTDDDAELERLDGVVSGVAGCALVSERLQARQALEAMQREMAAMLGIWLAVALVLVSIAMRSLLFGVRAALPAAIGVAAAAGLFGLLDRPLTPVAAAGFTLVMGLGIDYGIFMQSRRPQMVREAAPAVLASALTTLAAFGALAIARTRAMADLGAIILVGVGVAVLAALVLVPALSPGERRDEVER